MIIFIQRNGIEERKRERKENTIITKSPSVFQ